MSFHTSYASSNKSLPNIILASTSPFRKQLLQKLNLSFDQEAPNINESPLSHELPKEMVARLSNEKAQKIAHRFPNSIIIASDQCATYQEQPIGKPHTMENAVKQLQQFSQQTITFYTGLTVINTVTSQQFECMDTTQVQFRKLSPEVIKNYLDIEQPFNCAGSFKSEGLGITLFKKISSQDPNALIGLPLIELTGIFYKMGYALPLSPK